MVSRSLAASSVVRCESSAPPLRRAGGGVALGPRLPRRDHVGRLRRVVLGTVVAAVVGDAGQRGSCWRRRRGGRSRSSRRRRLRARARSRRAGRASEPRAARPARVDQHRALRLGVGDLVLHPRHRDLDLLAARPRVVQRGGDEPALGPARQRRAAARAPDDGRWLVRRARPGPRVPRPSKRRRRPTRSARCDALFLHSPEMDGERDCHPYPTRDNHPDGRSSVTMGACSREGSRDRLTAVDLLPGVRSSLVDTDRIRMRVLESGPADGVPVVFVHGNLSTSRFYEHLLPELPPHYRVIAPDMRGFGDSDPAPLDATRGLADWADDTAALLRALDVAAPPHLVGWSTGGAAIARFALDRPVASLTFLDPVSPYGYGDTPPSRTQQARVPGRRDQPRGRRAAAGGRHHRRQPVHRPQHVPRVLRRARVRRAARRPAGRRDPQDPPRRHELPRRRHGVRQLAGVRARHVGHPQRAVAAVLPLGGDRRPRPEAPGAVDARRAWTSSWPTARRWRWARSARPGAVPGLAGRGRLPAAADGEPRSARCSTATPRRAARVRTEIIEAFGPRAAPRRGPAVARDLPGVPYDDRVNDRRRSGRARPMEGCARSGKIRPDPGAALLELYDAALPQVYGYLLARCGRPALAEDLTAETFLAAVAALSDGNRRRPPARAGWSASPGTSSSTTGGPPSGRPAGCSPSRARTCPTPGTRTWTRCWRRRCWPSSRACTGPC